MKVLIDIPDDRYKRILKNDSMNHYLKAAVRNGTPLPKGHWTERTMHDNGFFMPNCSECGAMQPYAHHTYRSNFCPNCGADMRGKQNESAD